MDNTKALNIGQRVFLFNLDAYEKFNLYHKMIKDHFKRYNNHQKKLEDIEFKIADLFDIELNGDDVLNFKNIENVIDKVGFSSDWDELYDSDKEAPEETKQVHKLFRSTTDTIISGVCGGLAVYFRTEAIYVRIATVLATIFFPPLLLLYLTMWFIAPTDITVNQRTIQSPDFTPLKDVAKSSGNFLVKIMGAILLLIAISIIGTIIVGTSIAVHNLELNMANLYFINKSAQDFLITTSIIFIIGPFVFLFLLAVRMIINRPFPKYTWLTVFLIWLASILSTIMTAKDIVKEFFEEASFKETLVMDKLDSNLLVINTDFIRTDNDLELLLPKIRLRAKSTSEDVSINTLYSAYGPTRSEAKLNAKKIKFAPSVNNNTVTFPGKIELSDSEFYRLQEVDVLITVPVGMTIIINNFNRDHVYLENRFGSYYDQGRLPRFTNQIKFISSEKGFLISED